MAALFFASGCQTSKPTASDGGVTFGDDVAFLNKHVETIVLRSENGQSQVAVVPEYQGRVMTSTAGGDDGMSFGWLYRDVIASEEWQPHINVFGGEDRIWLGPEGGQFSIFFKKGDPFDLEHWQTPAPIDYGAWEMVHANATSAQFRKETSLTNYSDATFDIRMDRTINLLNRDAVEEALGMGVNDDVRFVAFESDNRVTNIGNRTWTEDSGLLSIWILCMFTPSPTTNVVIPFKADPNATAEDIVNDAYFGKVPVDRLKVYPERGVLFFRCDGKYRSKIGIRPEWALPYLGSYDSSANVLTVAKFTLPPGATDYVNSMWEMQEHPFGGDVANSYNDGPPEPGKKPLGPFYELESSSPALALAPNQTGRHVHQTMHFQGPKEELNKIAEHVFGVSLEEISTQFK